MPSASALPASVGFCLSASSVDGRAEGGPEVRVVGKVPSGFWRFVLEVPPWTRHGHQLHPCRPGGNPGENLKSISNRCHPILVAFVWELTKKKSPLGCLQGGEQHQALRAAPHQSMCLSRAPVQTDDHLVSTKDDGWANFDDWLGAREGGGGRRRAHLVRGSAFRPRRDFRRVRHRRDFVPLNRV